MNMKKNVFENLLKRLQGVPDEFAEELITEDEVSWIRSWQEWAKDEEGK